MIFIEAEVLREGNDQTLNNLDEGVVILNREDLSTCLINQAASRLGHIPDSMK
jgi:hypothetical protein